MRFSFSSLSLVLSFFSLARAGVFEDHGYIVVSDRGMHMLISPYYSLCEPLNVINFDAQTKIASIIVANNDEELDHDQKLGLAEIYTTLAEMSGLKPDDMKWVVFDVDEEEDPETTATIAKIRAGRNLDPKQDTQVLPSDKEWTAILDMEYYKKLLQVNSKPVKGVNLAREAFVDGDVPEEGIPDSDDIYSKDRIYFALSSSKAGLADQQAPFDDEEQAAALTALFAEEREKEAESLEILNDKLIEIAEENGSELACTL
ncbi:hypothetical protein CFO_g5317 [Ceratocystis platani]|uniref:Uncharacterized protein n=1 Tax=Ceratocystis fimbriata f. sp. platani TaxID=88771 RepID=A0A0F8BJ82_CERFI|nr:hypothetical protein CFO_g5317 [Ceratocystis platani]